MAPNIDMLLVAFRLYMPEHQCKTFSLLPNKLKESEKMVLDKNKESLRQWGAIQLLHQRARGGQGVKQYADIRWHIILFLGKSKYWSSPSKLDIGSWCQPPTTPPPTSFQAGSLKQPILFYIFFSQNVGLVSLRILIQFIINIRSQLA